MTAKDRNAALKAEALRMALEHEHKEQISRQGFTCPRPSKCEKNYGSEYEEREAGSLKLWEKCLLVAGVVFVLGMCMRMMP